MTDERHLFILDKSLFDTILREDCYPVPSECPFSWGRFDFSTQAYDRWLGSVDPAPLGYDRFVLDWSVLEGALTLHDTHIVHFGDKKLYRPSWAPREQKALLAAAIDAYALFSFSLSIANIERQSRPGHALRTAKKSITPARYTHVTTIRVPNVKYLPADEDHPPTGRSVRAHLRRGHSRMQHHGPWNSLTKQVQIAPTFVKVDADFVPGPKTYRLVGAKNETFRSQPSHGTAGPARQLDADDLRVGGRT